MISSRKASAFLALTPFFIEGGFFWPLKANARIVLRLSPYDKPFVTLLLN